MNASAVPYPEPFRPSSRLLPVLDSDPNQGLVTDPGLEEDRLAALHALAILDTPREERFDRITRTAQRLLDAPIVMVSLVDRDRQWFKSCIGLEVRQTPRSVSFCARAIASGQMMVVEDAKLDPRFASNPLVLGPPHVRFYAGQPLTGPSGHRLGTLCVIDQHPRTLDAADRKALADLAEWADLEIGVVHMSRAAREMDRLKDEFVAMVSHELRTPLAAVSAAVELLAGGTPPQDERSTRLLDLAGDNSARLVRLVEDILDVQRLGLDTLTLRRESADLAAVARRAAAEIGSADPAAAARIFVAGGPARVFGDVGRLTQVFGNLLVNALKFSGPDSPVRVRVRMDVQRPPEAAVGVPEAVAEVSDRGVGIPAEALPRIFQKFVQLDAAGRGGGAGLGLAITEGLVKAHDGQITVHSKEGQGTTFTIRIPAFVEDPDQQD
ncbi:MAG TPA: GAF domain-containing sensor histidine kinase [Actinocrinis sp.]|nr:GAF domain-containing sensor histidine kinase [Actinocrinis sp.]